MIGPYVGEENDGILFYTQERVNEFAIEANRAGLQIEVHAIGDRAFNQAVDAIEQALLDKPRENYRHTIIHACIPTKEGLEKVAKYNIGIDFQPVFLEWPLEHLEYLEDILLYI